MKLLYFRALATRVLAVAVKCEISWCAYCDAVPGKNHASEVHAVMEHGDKLPEHIARSIFPYVALLYED